MAVESVSIGGLDLTTTDADGVDWSADTIAGWGGTAGTLALVQKVRQRGAWAGASFNKPRAVSVSGTAVVPSDALAATAPDALISAVSLGESVLSITESGVTRTATVRRDGEVIINWPPGSTRLFEWSFQVAAPDPRKFGAELTVSTGLPSSTGGVSFPLSFPLAFTAVTVSGQVSLTNPGNASGPVRLRIDGPVTGPIVTHVGSGRALVFSSSLTLGAGEFITVDMERREVLAQGQSSRNGWVTGRGWSTFEPGVNTWSFSALAHDPAASLSVTATPAWE